MKYVTREKSDDASKYFAVSMSCLIIFYILFFLQGAEQIILIFQPTDWLLFSPVGPILTILLFVSFLWTIVSLVNYKKVTYLYTHQSFDFKTVTERDISDRIDLWHTLDRDTGELREFLGMTIEEYKEFFERPNEFYEKYDILEND